MFYFSVQKVSVPIWSNAVCRQKYGKFKIESSKILFDRIDCFISGSAAPGGIIDSMICAGKDARDSCSGDSGGLKRHKQ